jgi:hypothetical protein
VATNSRSLAGVVTPLRQVASATARPYSAPSCRAIWQIARSGLTTGNPEQTDSSASEKRARSMISPDRGCISITGPTQIRIRKLRLFDHFPGAEPRIRRGHAASPDLSKWGK